MKNDEALMTAYAAGDQTAFDELFVRYAPLLKRIFARRLPASSDVEDLVQQTFLQLHRARLDYRSGLAFRPWLFTIAFNLQRSARRSPRHRNATPLDEAALAHLSVPHVAVDDRRDVRRALESLPAETREVISLHWLEGLSFEEVATLVGASVSAVKVRAHRGYALLRQRFEPEL